MTVSRKMLFAAMMSACAAAVQTVSADASADSIMLRRKPAAASPAVQPVVAPAPEPVALPVAQPVAAPVAESASAVQPVAAPSPEPVVQPVAESAPAVQPTAVQAEVSVEKVAAEKPEDMPEKKEKKAKKTKAPARDAVITADRTDYDRKEGVVLFDRNVHVDDEQYQMHTDRLFLFLDGTNDLKRLVAIGNVAITNENRRAYCARATFNKKLGRIVMYSSDETVAELREEGKKGSEVKGEKITFWIDSEQVEVENPVITMPGGFGGKDSLKKAMGR